MSTHSTAKSRKPSSANVRPLAGPVPSGPSSFPRRAPLSVTGSRLQSTTSSSSASSSTKSGQKSIPPDNMARKLTRFYTASFEKRPVITLCITNCILSTLGDACAQLIPILTAQDAAAAIPWDADRSLRFAVFGFSLGPVIEKWNRFLEHAFPLRPLSQVFDHGDLPKDASDSALAEKIRLEAEKEGFRVNIERGDIKQGQQFRSKRPGTPGLNSAEGGHVVDPQTVAMPNTGQVSVAALAKRVAADQLFMAPLGLAIFISTMAVLEGLEWDEIKERYNRLYWPILLVNWQIWPIIQVINFRYMPLRYRVPFSASLGVLWTVFLSFRQAKATK